MSKGVLKCVVLKGKLENGTLRLNFVNNETTYGLWKISLRDISTISAERLNEIINVSCNLVSDKRLNTTSYGIEAYNVNLATFSIDLKKGLKQTVTFGPSWFTVNSSGKELGQLKLN